MTEKEHGSVAMGDIRPAGHCDDDQAWHSFSAEYKNRSRADLGKGGMTDFALANAQFMCDRNSLDLIVYQTAVKERIRWLSIQLAAALGAPQPAHGTSATERVPTTAGQGVEADRLRRMVERRDEFIIANGLWAEFNKVRRNED